jgi:uncharacterized membrane protein
VAGILHGSAAARSPVFLLIPLLVGLSRFGGIRQTTHLIDDIADALVAIAVAWIAASVTLWIFGLLTPAMPLREVIGKIALQVFPGSISAMLAQNQLGGGGGA